MTINDKIQMYKEKVAFVSKISDAMTQDTRPIKNVDKVDYIIFNHIANPWVEEFVVVTFKGGAISVRTCSGTNCSGILTAVAKLIDGGYYDEVDHFEKLFADDNWKIADYCPPFEL